MSEFELTPGQPSWRRDDLAIAAANSWDERYRREQRYLHEGPVQLVREFFDRYGGQLGSGPILGVGCGNGRNLQEAARRGYLAFGIDISGEALAQLGQRFQRLNLSADIRLGDFRALPYGGGSFSGVLAINVFQHNDWAGAVRSFAEVGRVLVQRGLFLLRVRSTTRPLDPEPEVLIDHGVTYIPHGGTKSGITLHHDSEPELRELAAANGLEVVELDETVRRGMPAKKDASSWVGVFRKKE